MLPNQGLECAAYAPRHSQDMQAMLCYRRCITFKYTSTCACGIQPRLNKSWCRSAAWGQGGELAGPAGGHGTVCVADIRLGRAGLL
jgi:hypothetical protein